MSCGLALAVALAISGPVATAPIDTAAVAEAAPLAREPLFADIIARSSALKAIVDAWASDRAADAPDFFAGAAFTRFRSEAAQLAEKDMEAHIVLRDRGNDDDLKCILRGIAEDLPKRLDALQAAPDASERAVALSELSYLLNDNVEVITSPPQPAGPPVA